MTCTRPFPRSSAPCEASRTGNFSWGGDAIPNHTPFDDAAKADAHTPVDLATLFVHDASPIWVDLQCPINHIVVGARGAGKTSRSASRPLAWPKLTSAAAAPVMRVTPGERSVCCGQPQGVVAWEAAVAAVGAVVVGPAQSELAQDGLEGLIATASAALGATKRAISASMAGASCCAQAFLGIP